jgi:hypothetical protein
MGGFGSGRRPRPGARRPVEDFNPIDIRRLHRDGFLKPGRFLTLSWSCGGEPAGMADIQVETGGIRLIYRVQTGDGDPGVNQPVDIIHTPCHYGGSRPWFRCPDCARRVAVLYGAGKYFLCRHCHNLAYRSQSLNKSGRLLEKALKIKRRLGVNGGIREPALFRPKGMRQKTFDRLRGEALRLEGEFWGEMAKLSGL